MAFSLAVYETPTGAIIEDWTRRASNTTFTTNEHGFDSLQADIHMSRRNATQWLRRKGMPHITLCDRASERVWEGRLEDVSIEDEGIHIGAYGYWRAYSDNPYTSLWIKTDFEDFTPVTDAVGSAYTPEMYDMSLDGRIQITTKKGEVYGNNTNYGSYVYRSPHLGGQKIVQVAFTYETNVTSAFGVYLGSWDELFSVPASEWAIAGNGAVQTGTVTQTLATPRSYIAFSLYSSASHTSTVDTGAHYFRITQVIIKTSIASSDIRPDDIVKSLVSFVSSKNASQVSPITSRILANTFDLTSGIWEDTYPSQIIEELSARGDASSRVWEAKVWLDRILWFQPKETVTNMYYVDDGDVKLEKTAEKLYNSVYATYKAFNGDDRIQRTADVLDSASINQNAIKRTLQVNDGGTSPTDAANRAASAVATYRDLAPRASLSIRRAFDEYGNRVPLYRIRSGDLIVFRAGITAIEQDARFSQFLIAKTSYSTHEKRITVEPADPAASLVTLLGGTY